MTDNTAQLKRLEQAKETTNKKFGVHSAALGNERYSFNVVPSPSLMLDYKLGIGGFPYRHMVELFGSNGLGKTSAIGYGVIANVQKEGKLPAIIAAEPTFDAEWAQKIHGLDPDLLLINRPDNAEMAFEMLHDLVFDNLVDYILFDSVGALAAESETKEEGKKKAFGISGVVTSGLNAIMPRLYKNNQGLLIINQQRQDTKTRAQAGVTMYETPGGEALKHHAMIRIQLKPGKDRYKVKIDGEDVMVGRELKCTFKKNKLAQAANKSAEFTFFNIETPEYGLGIDKTADILNTAKVAGVIEPAGAWLRHHAFPDGKLNGKKALTQYIQENPEVVNVIREEVLAVMVKNELEAAAKNKESESSNDND